MSQIQYLQIKTTSQIQYLQIKTTSQIQYLQIKTTSQIQYLWIKSTSQIQFLQITGPLPRVIRWEWIIIITIFYPSWKVLPILYHSHLLNPAPLLIQAYTHPASTSYSMFHTMLMGVLTPLSEHAYFYAKYHA